MSTHEQRLKPSLMAVRRFTGVSGAWHEMISGTVEVSF